MKYFNPEITKVIAIGSRKYLVNDKYYIKNFSDWDEELRDWLAEKEALKLNSEHIFVIYFLRHAFEHHRRHPVVRMITTALSGQFGNKHGTVKYFHTLFPGGIHQAFLIAGLPMQDSCC
jgi:TusE/DsrC/DsvC family sulfur relay protein